MLRIKDLNNNLYGTYYYNFISPINRCLNNKLLMTLFVPLFFKPLLNSEYFPSTSPLSYHSEIEVQNVDILYKKFYSINEMIYVIRGASNNS